MYTVAIRGPLIASLALLIGACGTSDGETVHDYEDLDSDTLEAIVARTAEPVGKATVRYHLAVKLIEQANARTTLAEERERLRERTRQIIAGFSDGVADEEFPETRFAADGTMLAGTFADMEAELLFRLDHATAGGTLAEVAGTRLDGGSRRTSWPTRAGSFWWTSGRLGARRAFRRFRSCANCMGSCRPLGSLSFPSASTMNLRR